MFHEGHKHLWKLHKMLFIVEKGSLGFESLLSQKVLFAERFFDCSCLFTCPVKRLWVWEKRYTNSIYYCYY